ncbi:MAG TPA: hypothetical protein VFN61_12095 [Acidimicrobiales bacterium]|nr:hypothetical protein [Acidimicrobiales bacterium]
MNWSWLGPLALGGGGAAILVYFHLAVRTELSRARLVRAEVEDARAKARRLARARAAQGAQRSDRLH